MESAPFFIMERKKKDHIEDLRALGKWIVNKKGGNESKR